MNRTQRYSEPGATLAGGQQSDALMLQEDAQGLVIRGHFCERQGQSTTVLSVVAASETLRLVSCPPSGAGPTMCYGGI